MPENEEIIGVKFSEFPSVTPGSTDEVVGLHGGDNARFTIANLILAVRQGLTNLFVPVTRTINGKSLSSDVTLDSTDVGAQEEITASGILKGNGAGGVSAATPETDYGTYSKPSGGIPASDLANGVIPTVPSAYTSNPAMDGTASPGSTGEWADGGHVHPSDTTKANQAQLATVETGSTASVAHAVGEYFCWNGLLYRATAAISVGQSFTPGTNCYQTTAMDMVPPRINRGDLNDYTTPGMYMWPATAATMPTNVPLVAQSVMVVLRASSADRVCQIVFAHSATRNGAFYRWLFDDAWTSWYTIG